MKNIFKKIWKAVIFTALDWIIKEVWKFIDTDNDGYLSEEEVRAIPKRLRELSDKFKEY